jgi:ribosomal protein S27AE
VFSVYKRKWSAKCPRCSESTSYADHKCQNCGKSQILAFQTGSFVARNVTFGCPVCAQPLFGFLACEKCGAKLHTPAIKTSTPRLIWVGGLVFLIFIGAIVVITWMGIHAG